MEALTAEILSEVPDQLVDYMVWNGIVAKPRPFAFKSLNLSKRDDLTQQSPSKSRQGSIGDSIKFAKMNNRYSDLASN